MLLPNQLYRLKTFAALLLGLVLWSGVQSAYALWWTSAPVTDQGPSVLLAQGERALKAGHYSAAIKAFEALDAQYPFGDNTRQGQLDVIYVYYQHGDKAEALAAADRYIHLYPRGPYTDYAYYMKGVSYMEYGGRVRWLRRALKLDRSARQLSPLRHAFVAFDALMRYFPHSVYAGEARHRMVYIRNILARHELEVARFYFKRHAYIGAANRAGDVVRHYQGSAPVGEALKLMLKAYRAMRAPHLAQDTQRILDNNPNLR